MAVKAKVRIEKEGVVTEIPESTLHVVFDVRRTSSRSWYINYAVTRRLGRPTTADGRTLISEWLQQTANKQRWEAVRDANPGTPAGVLQQQWLAEPEIRTELNTWVAHVRATRIEYFYDPIPDLTDHFESDSGDDIAGQCYRHLMARAELIDAVEE